jgi:hypothetical protein
MGDLKGAAELTDDCFGVRATVKADEDAEAGTWREKSLTMVGRVPAVANRQVHDPNPPPLPCDADPTISNEEILARIEPGEARVALGTAAQLTSWRRCVAETGCTAWTERSPSRSPHLSADVVVRDVSIAAVLGWAMQPGSRDRWVHPVDSLTAPITITAGAFNGAWDTLRPRDAQIGAMRLFGDGGQAFTGRFTDTHLVLAATTNEKDPRGLQITERHHGFCIAIPPHP